MREREREKREREEREEREKRERETCTIPMASSWLTRKKRAPSAPRA
jgi:hypothetical protein